MMTFDKERFKACVDWYHANLDALLPQYCGKYVACPPLQSASWRQDKVK